MKKWISSEYYTGYDNSKLDHVEENTGRLEDIANIQNETEKRQ